MDGEGGGNWSHRREPLLRKYKQETRIGRQKHSNTSGVGDGGSSTRFCFGRGPQVPAEVSPLKKQANHSLSGEHEIERAQLVPIAMSTRPLIMWQCANLGTRARGCGPLL